MHTDIIVVLHRPQQVRNIGAAVRAMKNMGLRRLRLVRPAPFDPADILGIAHRSEEILDALERFETLDAALADATFVAGTSGRPRSASARVLAPREAAPELLRRAAAGPVALLFGPEDNGLANEDLDRCHLTLTIPSDPAYPSLNLAQALLLVAYELRMVAMGMGEHEARPDDAGPEQGRMQYAASAQGRMQYAPAQRTGVLHTPDAGPDAGPDPRSPANAAQIEALLGAAERALWGIEFFKAGQATSTLRTLRALVHRAEPDAREARLLTAMCVEALQFLRRRGLAPAEPPPPEDPPPP